MSWFITSWVWSCEFGAPFRLLGARNWCPFTPIINYINKTRAKSTSIEIQYLKQWDNLSIPNKLFGLFTYMNGQFCKSAGKYVPVPLSVLANFGYDKPSWLVFCTPEKIS